jgi:hypothetical protein
MKRDYPAPQNPVQNEVRKMKTKDLSTRSWESLSAQDKRDRLLVIGVLRRLRNGEKFADIKGLGVSKALVWNHASLFISEDELND